MTAKANRRTVPRREFRTASRTLSCLLAVILAGACVSCKGKDKQPQRRVVLYCSADQAIAEPIIAEFEKQTGVKVLARFDTEASKTVGLVQRLRAQAGSVEADVFWSSEIFHTMRLAQEELLAPFQDPAVADWPAIFADPKGRWHGFALRARVIGYSTGRVPADEAPRRLEDLLDAKWKGRIVMADPHFGTTGGDVASWFAHYGREKARAILKGLKANGVRLVSGNSTAVRMVATGQADVCFTDTDDVYAAQRNGWSVALRFLKQGGEGALVIPNTVARIKGGPNPEAAKALIAFLLGGKAEEMLARSDSHNTPVHPSLVGREEFAKYAIPKALDINYEKVADLLPDSISEAGEILR